MNLGQLVDDQQACAIANQQFIGKAAWQTTNLCIRRGSAFFPLGLPPEQVLVASVPPAFRIGLLDAPWDVRPEMAFVPWRDSGLGLIVANAGLHGLVCAINMAGQASLSGLRHFEVNGRIQLSCARALGDEFAPPAPAVARVQQAMKTACTARSLSQSEFAAAAADIRALLLQPPPLALPGLPGGKLETLTFNVVLDM